MKPNQQFWWGFFFGIFIIILISTSGMVIFFTSIHFFSNKERLPTFNEEVSMDDIAYNLGEKGLKQLKISNKSNSMSPTIENNWKVFVVNITNPREIKRGDIIVYKTVSGDIMHRIYLTLNLPYFGYHYIVIGDNNSSPDQLVSFEQIFYKVVGVQLA